MNTLCGDRTDDDFVDLRVVNPADDWGVCPDLWRETLRQNPTLGPVATLRDLLDLLTLIYLRQAARRRPLNADNRTAVPVFSSAREAALVYLDLDLAVLDLPPGTKRPEEGRTGWKSERASLTDLDKRFPEGQERTVAVFNGAPSGNLADTDLDCPEAIEIAKILLPATGWIFGREGAPGAHRIYRTDVPFEADTKQYLDGDGGVILELRGTGGYTVWPGSRHRDTDEAISWEKFDAAGPGQIPLADLRRAMDYLAVATLLAIHWPHAGSKARHRFALAVAGGLARAGVPVDVAAKLVYSAARAGGDEEAKERGQNVRGTYTKHAAGEQVTGWTTVTDILGESGRKIVARLHEYLNLGGAPDEPEEWPPFIPLGDVPAVPVFPLEVFPEPLHRFAEQLARVVNAPVDYCGLSILTIAGGALANSRHLRIAEGHEQSPCAFGVITGPPGSAKSPILKTLRRPLDSAQRRYIAEYQAARTAWEEEEPEDRGPPPILRRCVVSDTTVESLAITLDQNQRGVILIRDELSAFVAALGQYKGGKGHDKQVFLDLWSGGTICVDRKSEKDRKGVPMYVADPFTSVLGGIQPAVLYKLRGDMRRGFEADDDGFFDRFLPVYPEDLPAREETWETLDKDLVAYWEAIVEKLLALEMVQEGEDQRPFFVQLTEDAKAVWARFTRQHAAEMNTSDFPVHLRGAWSKLRGYAGRLALIAHFLRWACGDRTGEVPDNARVDGESMARAVLLVAYFKEHVRKVHAVVDADPVLAAARKAVDWIGSREQPAAPFSKRALHRGCEGTLKTVEQTERVLHLLERHHLVRAASGSAVGRHGPGRKASPLYEVNPAFDGTIPRQYRQNGDSEYPRKNCVDSVDTVEGDARDWGLVEEAEGREGPDHDVSAEPLGQSRQNEGVVAPGTNCVDTVDSVEGGEGCRSSIEAAEDTEPNGNHTATTPRHYRQNRQNSGPDVPGVDPQPSHLIRDAGALGLVLSALAEASTVSIDLETTGLSPREDRVRLLSIATDTREGDRFAWLIDCFAVDPAPLLQALAEKSLLAHNAKFELGFLSALGCVPRGEVRDTWILAKVLTAGSPEFNSCDLADCCARYLGVALDKTEQRADWSGPLSPEQLKYAANDVLVLPRLYEKLQSEVRAAGLTATVDLEQRALSGIAWTSQAGVAVDRPTLEGLSAGFTADTERLEAELNALAPPRPGESEQTELFPVATRPWNWNSPVQVKQVLTLVGLTVTGTDDVALSGLDHPLAAKLRDYRAARKMASNYGEAMLARIAPDGRVYASWNQLGSAAGRTSGSAPNLQQVPKDSAYRNCFVAPPGRVLIKADYSQIELRIAARVTGDKNLLTAYRNNEDLHTRTARAVLGKEEVTKADRQLAKCLNFGLLYGMGAEGLRKYASSQYGVELSEDDARRYRQGFFRAYPGLRRWHQRVGAQEGTLTTTTLGGRRRLEVESFMQKLNTPVQGTGADGFKAALALLWERRDQCPGAFPVLLVHDEIVVEADADQAEQAAAWLKQAMLDGMAPLIAPVPVEVAVTMGRTWAGD